MNLLENQRLAETVDSSYIDLESMLMQNIARHIQDYGQAIDSDKWLLQKLAEIGKLNEENIKLIAQMAGVSQTAAERMLDDAMEDAISATDPGFRYLARRGIVDGGVDAGKSKTVKQVMSSLRQQAGDTLNICNTTMLYKARDAYSNLVQSITRDAKEIAEKQSFIDALGKHATAVTIGAESRQQAVRKCIKEFNDKGIPAFVDKAGREWTPEAYVNMAMRNTARQTAEEVQTARCKDFGVNLIAIDSHSGARPKCAKDQGKIFDLNNKSGYTEDLKGKKIKYYPWKSSSYGEPDGILGINCGHHKWPFIPGVNIQRYFPTEDFDANDKLYKETQVQRALERDVRKQKRECMLFDEIGDEEAFKETSVKLKQKEAKLKAYVDSKDHLHRRKDREQVVGFDRGISANAVAANKEANRKSKKATTQKRTSQTVMTEAEQKEFAGLKSKYKSLEEAMLFGDAKEAERYSLLQKKQVQTASANDFKIQFDNQNMPEPTLNSWRDDPKPAERDAISSYSRSGYLMMNDYLRNGNYIQDKYKDDIKALEKYLDRNIIKSEILLKRGTDMNAMNHLLGDGWKTNINGQIGKIISDKGFLSTTPYEGGGFGGSVKMYIKAPKGTKGAYIKNYCANENEKEFLLQHGTKLEIKNIEVVNNKYGDSNYNIHVEVIVDE